MTGVQTCALPISARVQGLAVTRAIFATGAVVENPETSKLLAASGLVPIAQHRTLRGTTDALTLYEIP